ncbi:winged helix-turn-helix domain-containing protein [Serratia fonticola]|nr:winged helix-turn-helix domain-containing protein [Serratia fonticola]
MMIAHNKNSQFSISLLNGFIAVYLASTPEDLLFYSYNSESAAYELHTRHHLKPMESHLLLALLSAPGQVVRNSILQSNGSNGKSLTSNKLRQLILSLRVLMKDTQKPSRIIKNQPRIGYSIHQAVKFTGSIQSHLSGMGPVPPTDPGISLMSKYSDVMDDKIQVIKGRDGLKKTIYSYFKRVLYAVNIISILLIFLLE